MRVESLDCNKCGAPLEVPEGVNFAKCAHCGSRLRVHRESSVHYTEVLGKIEQSTRRLEGEVRVLQLQLEVRDLDDAWAKQRESLMHRDQFGKMHQPGMSGAVSMYAAVVVGVCFFTLAAFGGGMPVEMCFFVVIGAIVGLGIAAHLHNKAKAYLRAEKAYLAKRRLLMSRMAEAREAAGS